MDLTGYIVAGCTAAGGWVFGYLTRRAAKRDKEREEREAEYRKLVDQVTALQLQISVLTTQVSPLWATVQARIAKDLHQPHEKYEEMDRLLEALEALTITPPERRRLEELLLQRSEDMSPEVDQAQRDSAQLMAMVMHKVVIEAAAIAAVSPTLTVTAQPDAEHAVTTDASTPPPAGVSTVLPPETQP